MSADHWLAVNTSTSDWLMLFGQPVISQYTYCWLASTIRSADHWLAVNTSTSDWLVLLGQPVISQYTDCWLASIIISADHWLAVNTSTSDWLVLLGQPVISQYTYCWLASTIISADHWLTHVLLIGWCWLYKSNLLKWVDLIVEERRNRQDLIEVHKTSLISE